MKISQEITALFRKQIQRNGSLLRLLATGLVVLVIMLVLTGPSRFLSAKSISAMMLQMPELGILTLAVTFALFLGGIDLSVVSTANLSGILQCLLVAILGGISPFGGFGNVAGILIAIVTLQMLSSGFNMLRFSSYQKLAVWGAILILVMVMNYLLEKMRERRNIKKNLRKTQCQN